MPTSGTCESIIRALDVRVSIHWRCISSNWWCCVSSPVLVHIGVSDGQRHHGHAIHVVWDTLWVLYISIYPTSPWNPLSKNNMANAQKVSDEIFEWSNYPCQLRLFVFYVTMLCGQLLISRQRADLTLWPSRLQGWDIIIPGYFSPNRIYNKPNLKYRNNLIINCACFEGHPTEDKKVVMIDE